MNKTPLAVSFWSMVLFFHKKFSPCSFCSCWSWWEHLLASPLQQPVPPQAAGGVHHHGYQQGPRKEKGSWGRGSLKQGENCSALGLLLSSIHALDLPGLFWILPLAEGFFGTVWVGNGKGMVWIPLSGILFEEFKLCSLLSIEILTLQLWWVNWFCWSVSV